MRWFAILPLKSRAARKERLASVLSASARLALSEILAARALACLRATPTIERIIVLSADAPEASDCVWARDEGRGLNAELEALRARLEPAGLVVVHGDLPLLNAADIEALIEAASDAPALAPDRFESGTNAVAIPPGAPFEFQFGPDSFARHRTAIGKPPAIVRRPGLALDIDTQDDLAEAGRRGFIWVGAAGQN